MDSKDLEFVQVAVEEIDVRSRVIMQLLAEAAIVPDHVTQIALIRIVVQQIKAQGVDDPALQGRIVAEYLAAATLMGFGGPKATYEVAKKH